MIKEKLERIEELEEALRESVKITAERELVMAQQQAQMETTEKQVRPPLPLKHVLHPNLGLYTHISPLSGRYGGFRGGTKL